MKKMFFIACLLVAAAVQAQEVTRSLGDFSTVKVYDRISVKLVKGNENKIVLTGTRANDVELVTKGDELKVRMKFSKLLKGEDITATLYYKRIDDIEASEGAYISSQDTFKATAFKLNAKEGAKIKVTLDVQKLEGKLHTGGEFELTGKAASQDVTITSGGILKARNLITAQTEISVNAGGEADVNATEFVDAKTRAGGNINVYGSPKQVNKKTTAGGSIEIRS